MEYPYRALKVEQKPGAEPFYLLSASAEDLLKWADAPRTNAAFMAGYQRELDDRHNDITEFLEQDDLNVIPAAIIVALQPDTYEVVDDDDGTATITVTAHDPGDLQALASSVLARFEARLGPNAEAELDAEAEETIVDDDEEEDDLGAPDSYVALITRELRKAAADIESLPATTRAAVIEFLTGVSRPGLILDGQHRVFGAKNVNPYDVRLPVVVMPGLAISEQVFHFYVLNNKAKPLKPTDLRRTISTTLTDGEIEALYARFKQAKLDAEEAQWTHLIDTRADSPFRGLLNRGLEGEVGFIPENVMDGVIRTFMKMPKKYQRAYKDVEEWPDTAFRMSQFFAFWRTIRKLYPVAWDAAVAQRGGQIFQKVSLVVLQEHLLNLMNTNMPLLKSVGQPSPLSGEIALSSFIETQLESLPSEFFTREWQQKGLDTGPGRARFREQIQDVIEANGKNIGTRWLFVKTK